MNVETPKQGDSGGPAPPPSQSASTRSPFKRTLLFAGVFALLAMVFVPEPNGYRLIFDASDTRVALFQLLLNVGFAALVGAIVANLPRRALLGVLSAAGTLAILLVALIGFLALEAKMKAGAQSEQATAQFDLEHGDFESAKKHLLKSADYLWWVGTWKDARKAKRQANDRASMEQQYTQVQRERQELEKGEQERANRQREELKKREREKQEASKRSGFDPEAFVRSEPVDPFYPRAKAVPPSASSEKFRQLDLHLVEPYSFTMTYHGGVDGWIRNKSSLPINAVDIHVEIKNFSGDTFASETHTVRTQILPGRAGHVSFTVSSSPAQSGLSDPGSGVSAANEQKEAAEKNTTTSDQPITITRHFDIHNFAVAESESVQKGNWTWHMQIKAAGTKQ